ncbi:glutathione hydrolase 3-like isoform X1 [Typha latifolia]|uniref:glutathione hydrolase 3-like isoform X1 n=2 Tax=Typha latifolia TaxID=4733 RepID=UPI003C30B92F
MADDDLESSLLGYRALPRDSSARRRIWTFSAALLAVGILLVVFLRIGDDRRGAEIAGDPASVESEIGVVAADDGRCSEVGAAALRRGGHAVDAAVAAALCLGVVHPVSSGIGGGAFMIVRSADSGEALAFDSRETAPAAASQNMYENRPSSKAKGALSMGIPGELAGLHAAWVKYGRLPWKDLFQPAIRLAREGFVLVSYAAEAIESKGDDILADPGLRAVFAPNGKLLQTNDTCYNPALAETLEIISIQGPEAFYNGSVGESFINDVRNVGGIATMDDIRKYRIEVKEAMAANSMGYTILGMPPPSSGTVGIALVLNIFDSYKSSDAAKGFLGLHRLIEALKHMFAVRMDLGDPDFVNVTEYVADMLSPSFAEKLQQKIFDNTTFSPDYYMAKWSQLRDHGTSHLCIVDADRNAVSMTTTINSYFGAKVLSPSTGIVLNNEMDDFSTPDDATPDHLPPSPANFIEPKKRPLSSMAPLIVLKDNQLAGAIGASGGMKIIPAVLEVFLNHFILGMDPADAVRHPRVYHQLIPNKVLYENWTMVDGERFEVPEEAKVFLEQRGHQLSSVGLAAVVQLVAQDLRYPVLSMHTRDKKLGKKNSNGVFHGMLTAVSDPRKEGIPAGL